MPLEGIRLFNESMQNLGQSVQDYRVGKESVKEAEASAIRNKIMSEKYSDTNMGQTPEGKYIGAGLQLGVIKADDAINKTLDISDEKMISLLSSAAYRSKDPKMMQVAADALKIYGTTAFTKAEAISRAKEMHRISKEDNGGKNTISMRPLASAPFDGSLNKTYGGKKITFKKDEIQGLDRDVSIDPKNPMRDIIKLQTPHWWEPKKVESLLGDTPISDSVAKKLITASAEKIKNDSILPTLKKAYPVFAKPEFAREANIVAGAIIDQAFNNDQGFDGVFKVTTKQGVKLKNIDLSNFRINKQFYNIDSVPLDGSSIEVEDSKGVTVGGSDKHRAIENFIANNKNVEGVDVLEKAYNAASASGDEEDINLLYQEINKNAE